LIFRGVILVTFIFNSPDFESTLTILKEFIPFVEFSLTRVLPALQTFLMLNLVGILNLGDT